MTRPLGVVIEYLPRLYGLRAERSVVSQFEIRGLYFFGLWGLG